MEQQILEQIKRELECTVCLETFDDPRALLCQHIYCIRCLESLADGKTMISCPVCLKVTLLTAGEGVECLPKPVVVNKVIDTLTSLISSIETQDKSETGRSDLATFAKLCTLCDTLPVEIFCDECHEYMCINCFDKHLLIQGFEQHRSIEHCNIAYCDIHPESTSAKWCVDCKVMACVKCLMCSHSRHILRNFKTSEEKAQLATKIDLAEEQLHLIAENKKKVENATELMSKSFDSVANEITAWSEATIKAILTNTNGALARLHDKRSSNFHAIKVASEQLHDSKSSLEDFIHDARTSLDSFFANAAVRINETNGNFPDTRPSPSEFQIHLPSVVLNDVAVSDLCILTIDETKVIKHIDANVRTQAASEAAVIQDDINASEANEPMMSSAQSISNVDSIPSLNSSIAKASAQTSEIWRMSRTINFKVKKILDCICSKSKIFCRMKGSDDKEVLRMLSLEGKEIKCITTMTVSTDDTGLTFDPVRNYLILAYYPNKFRTISTDGDQINSFVTEMISGNSCILYCKQIDSLAVICHKPSAVSKLYLLDCDTFAVTKSFPVLSRPVFIDFDENECLFAVSSWLTSTINIYNLDGKCLFALADDSVQSGPDICFISGLLVGCNRTQPGGIAVWQVDYKKDDKSVECLLSKSNLPQQLRLLSKINNGEILLTGNSYITYIQKM